MRPLSISELADMVGGDYSQAECAGYGFAVGALMFGGGPVGWIGAAFIVWQAAESGCFK